MDPFMIATIVLIVGIVLIIIEALAPGSYLLIPGAVLTVLGFVWVAFPDTMLTWWSPAIAVLVAFVITVLCVKMYQRLGKTELPTTTVADSLVGRRGIVTVQTTVGNMKGKVRIGSDIWSATSDDEIPVGTEVEVVSSEGVHVHVCPLKED